MKNLDENQSQIGIWLPRQVCTYIQDGFWLFLSISSTKMKNEPKRATFSRNFPNKKLVVGWPRFSCWYWKSRGIVIKTYCKISISSWYPLDCLGRGANNQNWNLRWFYTWSQSKISLWSPFIIGSKLTFWVCCDASADCHIQPRS